MVFFPNFPIFIQNYEYSSKLQFSVKIEFCEYLGGLKKLNWHNIIKNISRYVGKTLGLTRNYNHGHGEPIGDFDVPNPLCES